MRKLDSLVISCGVVNRRNSDDIVEFNVAI